MPIMLLMGSVSVVFGGLFLFGGGGDVGVVGDPIVGSSLQPTGDDVSPRMDAPALEFDAVFESGFQESTGFEAGPELAEFEERGLTLGYYAQESFIDRGVDEVAPPALQGESSDDVRLDSLDDAEVLRFPRY
jgi:hypothetical protein